jgi:ABC-type nickel/cobalt efflux system permease component RcnA
VKPRALQRLLLALVLTVPAGVSAHPMGNFSISHYAAIRIEPDAVRLRYLVDLAEIPTFQALQESLLPLEPQHPAVRAYLARTVETLGDALTLELDGRRLALRVESSDLIFPPGAGGLPTLKIGAVYRASLPPAEPSTVPVLTYRDANYPGRAGWKEIVASAASGVTLVESTAPERDRSGELSDYPTDPAESPPQALEAQVVFTRVAAPSSVARPGPAPANPNGPSPPGRVGSATTRERVSGTASAIPMTRGTTRQASPESLDGVPGERLSGQTAGPGRADDTAAQAVPEALDLAANARSTPRDAFTALIAGPSLGPSMVLFALAVAVSLGAFHALEPGHGKTVVAAYLVGSRGTAGHALLLGLVVTASHTGGVYLLGAVTLYASRHVMPERLYPWLGAASGLLIAVLGASLLWRRLAGPSAAGHGHAHDHAHGPHAHPPSEYAEAHAPGLAHSHDAAHAEAHVRGLAPSHDAAHSEARARGLAPSHDAEHAQAHVRGLAPSHAHGHHHHHLPDGSVSLRALVALGVSGGIVPCPAALVVLLSAVAMGRVGFGLLLIVAFSVGLAAVLITIGLLVVFARRLAARFGRIGAEGPLVRRWLPITSAAVITVSGVVITVQALGG